jgi:hypothetical protein
MRQEQRRPASGLHGRDVKRGEERDVRGGAYGVTPNAKAPAYRTPDNPQMGEDHPGHEHDVDPPIPEGLQRDRKDAGAAWGKREATGKPDKPSPAGPHEQARLTDSDKTPGTGALPDPKKPEDDGATG